MSLLPDTSVRVFAEEVLWRGLLLSSWKGLDETALPTTACGSWGSLAQKIPCSCHLPAFAFLSTQRKDESGITPMD